MPHRRDPVLSDIREPTKVKMRLTVASADDQRSAVSDRQAAVITLNVGEEWETTDAEGETVFRRALLASATRTADLLLASESGTVLLPAWMFEVTYEVDAMSGIEPLECELPREVAHAEGKHTRGTLVISERFLKKGDPVELEATLVPSDKPGVTCRVEGKATLRDCTLDEMDLPPELHAAIRNKSSPRLVYGGLGFIALLFVLATISLRC